MSGKSLDQFHSASLTGSGLLRQQNHWKADLLTATDLPPVFNPAAS